MTTFDSVYRDLLQDIMQNGALELNERTGLHTRIRTGAHFDLDVSKAFPLLTLRKIPLKLFVAEQVWYLQGENKLDFFQKFSRIWDDFMEEDNTVESGYGYRWRGFFGRDQVDSLLQMLRDEPSSRQGVVVTWDPNTDGLASAKKKNVPCVPVWVANIVNGKLNFHVIFRSNDVMLGLPHDVAGFALLLKMLAQELEVEPGMMHYSISHAHVYENHFPNAEMLLTRSNEHPDVNFELPSDCYKRALSKDESLVHEILESMQSVYEPLPGVGRMQIAL